MIKKPPLGVMPLWLLLEKRKEEIVEAMRRFKGAPAEIPDEWFDELIWHDTAPGNCRHKFVVKVVSGPCDPVEAAEVCQYCGKEDDSD